MIKRQFGVLKTTAIGGLIFLLPLVVIGALLGQLVPIVMQVAEALSGSLPVDTAEGVALLVVISILLLLLLCFLAGVIARFSIGQRFSDWIEDKLLLFFPRYAIVREQMADNVGDDAKPRLKPVIVTFLDHQRVALESDRTEDLVAIYLPTAPDAWSGHVVYVTPDRVRPLDMEFNEAVATSERLGRESIAELFESGIEPNRTAPRVVDQPDTAEPGPPEPNSPPAE